jgi:hypothetical protein
MDKVQKPSDSDESGFICQWGILPLQNTTSSSVSSHVQRQIIQRGCDFVPQGQGYHAPQAAAIDEYGGMLE